MSHAFSDWDKAEEQVKRSRQSEAEAKKERQLKRAAELPHAKEVVLNHLERVGLGARLTDLERALLNIAIASVRGAR